MKLYYSKGACSLTIRIIIHEIGINCEFEAVDIRKKLTHKGEDFRHINPKGAVPTLQLDNGEVLTENIAIQQYLADTYHAHNLLPAIGNVQRYRVLEWLSYLGADLHKSFSPLFNPKLESSLKTTLFIPLLTQKLDYVNKSLNNNLYLFGDHFTLADSYCFVMLRWLGAVGLELATWPDLTRYVDKLSQRQSVQKALKEEQTS